MKDMDYIVLRKLIELKSQENYAKEQVDALVNLISCKEILKDLDQMASNNYHKQIA